MKVKRLAAALAVSVMTFSGAMSVSAAVPEGAFDPVYYAATYGDVRAAFGNDEEALYRHYLQFGIQEGRAGSAAFDVRAYRARYQDLEAAFGDDWEAYFRHYVSYGIQEGRNGSREGIGSAQQGTEGSDQRGGADQMEGPGQPNNAGQPGSAEQPDNAGQPGSAGQPDNAGQPGSAGQPDNAGQPGSAGQPDNAGQPGSAGQPDNAGQPGSGEQPDDAGQPGGGEQAQFMDALAREAFEAVNRYRAENGKSALTWSDSIYEAAKVRAQECMEEFSHTRPDGSSCFTVFSGMGISYGAAAENIAAGYSTGDDVALGWYNSPGHKKNMLGDSYKKAAIACYYAEGEDGYGYYWVNLFTD